MKLHSIICVSAIAVAASASALTSVNTFARLPVTSTLTNTVLSIPLAGCGASDATIYVTNLVMTANLKSGDKLLYKDGSAYYAWQLTTDGGTWQKMATSTDFGTSVTPSAEQTTLPCGKGCWLVRSGTTIAADPKIYLFGQVNNDKPDVTLTVGSDAVTYLLVGCPSVSGGLDLSTAWALNAAVGDTVQIPDSTSAIGYKEYTYDNGHWCKATAKTKTITTPKGSKTVADGYEYTALTANEVVVPAGTGFMYGRKTSAGALTLNWGD